MKKINCSIAGDLLPLYVDDVLSGDGRELVENHISGCAHCRELLEMMQKEIPVMEDTDTKPFRKIKRKLVARMALIIFLAVLVAATYIACEINWIPVKYVGDALMDDMEVVFFEDGVYLRREGLGARGDIIVVDDRQGVIKFYIGENVPDHFRLTWREDTCYTELMGYSARNGRESIREVDYCDKRGNVLYTLWKWEETERE